MTYYEYMMHNYLGQDNPNGDLAEDMAGDDKFPSEEKRYYEIALYLYRSNACAEAMDAFEDTYWEYRRSGLAGAIPRKFNPLSKVLEAIADELNVLDDDLCVDAVEDLLKRLRTVTLDAALLVDDHKRAAYQKENPDE